jgi:hypothetical protein
LPASVEVHEQAQSDTIAHCLATEQLDSLEHFLPETYQYLMDEMDTQHRHLMELKVQDFYTTQDHGS